MPYRLRRAAVSGSVTFSAWAKYWLKFSSPCSVVPHGVVPPAQLLRVPRTVVPRRSALVRSSGWLHGRAGDLEAAGGGEAAVEAVAADRGELAGAALLLHDDHREAVRGPGDLDLLAAGVLRVVPGEHQDLVGVLVVGDQDLAAGPAVLATALVQGEQREEVVVVTELARLRLGALAFLVELRGAAQDRVAPADDDLLRVPLRDAHLVQGVGGDRGEPQTARRRPVPRAGVVAAVAGAPAVGDGPLGAGADDGGTGRTGDRDDGGGAQGRPSGDDTGDHVTDVGVVAGVGRLVEAGVPAAEPAGQRRTAARVRSDQRKQLAHGLLRPGPGTGARLQPADRESPGRPRR